MAPKRRRKALTRRRLAARSALATVPPRSPPPARRALDSTTRRDLNSPRTFPGLSAFDQAILDQWLSTRARDIDELHTHVPLIPPPPLRDELDTPANRAMIATLWPRRVDAIIRRRTKWQVVEIKPGANHYALGQVLFYTFHARREITELANASPLILTDMPEPDLIPVLRAHGVALETLGAPLDLEPLPTSPDALRPPTPPPGATPATLPTPPPTPFPRRSPRRFAPTNPPSAPGLT